ncbi:Rv3654c family TadE-like protein [Gordonia iterans]|uniref:Rv3654c family TadE-like protein n=1 Tax=Gordonia iterans TaxID=1004901 RepID=UPI002D777B39|nr:Rv3654c family TadE-like protein [Gordonia iterans]
MSLRQNRRGPSRWSDERGFATVAAALTIAGLAVLLIAMFGVGGAVQARHRAQAAADLGALAAARSQLFGEGDPCARARDLTARQEGAPAVTGCVLVGEDVVVTVTVRAWLGRFGVRDAVARARAGPVEE